MPRTTCPRWAAIPPGLLLVFLPGAVLSGCSAATHSPTVAASTPVPATADGNSSAAAGPSPVGQITASTGSTTPSAAAECINLAAGAAVKAAATAAHRQYTHLVHIQPVPGDFYYGACGGIQYAATDFEAAPGAGPPESVGLQDDGAAMQYFLRPAGGGWRHVDSDGFPRDPRGCAAITTIPSPLAVIWHGCPSNRFQPAVGQG